MSSLTTLQEIWPRRVGAGDASVKNSAYNQLQKFSIEHNAKYRVSNSYEGKRWLNRNCTLDQLEFSILSFLLKRIPETGRPARSKV